MPGANNAGQASWLRNLLTGRGSWGRYRLVIAIILAIPCGIFGLIAADLAAWANSTGCFDDEFRSGVESVAIIGVIAGGVPALLAGVRRLSLLPFAIGAAGPALIFLVYVATYDPSGTCP